MTRPASATVLYRVVGEDVAPVGSLGGNKAASAAPNAFTASSSSGDPNSLVLGDVMDCFPFAAAIDEMYFFVPGAKAWRTLSSQSDPVPLTGTKSNPYVVRMRYLPRAYASRVTPGAVHSPVIKDPVVGKEKSSAASRSAQKSTVRRNSSSNGVAVSTVGAQLAKGLGAAKSKLFAWARKGAEYAQTAKERAAEKLKDFSGEHALIGNMEVTLRKKLADGGFSEVFIAIGADDKRYALKRCLLQEKSHLVSARKEIAAHNALGSDCEHVLELIGAEIVASKKIPRAKVAMLLFPLFRAGTLWDPMSKALKQRNDRGTIDWPFDSASVIHLAQGICKGLRAVHTAGLLHLDMKPHNVLIRFRHEGVYKSAVPVLMDLGSCRQNPVQVRDRKQALNLQDYAETHCSAPYRAPELYQVDAPCSVGASADVWSLGCTLYALSYGMGYGPFEDPEQGVMKLGILNASVDYHEHGRFGGVHFTKRVRTMIEAMLRRDPEKRITIDHLLEKL